MNAVENQFSLDRGASRKQIAISSLFLLTVSTLLVSCGQSTQTKHGVENKVEQKPVEGRLDGDVFVITQVGVPVKLPLIEVKVFKEAEIAGFLATNKATIFSGLQDAVKRYDEDAKTREMAARELDKRLRELRKEDDERREKLRIKQMEKLRDLGVEQITGLIRAGASSDTIKEAQERFKAAGQANMDRWEKEDAKREQERQQGEKEADEKKQQLEHSIRDKSSKVNNLKGVLAFDEKIQQDLFGRLPNPITSQKTDADGKFFFMLLATERYVLFAVASRAVEHQTERYVWLIPVSLGGQTLISVHLANDNLLTERLGEPSQDLLR